MRFVLTSLSDATTFLQYCIYLKEKE